MLTTELRNSISEIVQAPVLQMQLVSGGSINETYKICTQNKSYFIKLNKRNLYPGMFEKERRGLELLSATKAISLPEALQLGHILEYDFLLMNFLEPGKRIKNYYENFGRSLAELHLNTSPFFGLDHNNYIGSLEQINTESYDGISFFIDQRLEMLALKAYQNHLMPKEIYSQFQDLYPKIKSILPNEPASLLHGDLWSGNYITGPDGKAWLIDPAVYYGYREADLAMTRLFGGFDAEFYSAYHEHYPLATGWEERVGLFNLYPLLVHLNLFGGGYLKNIIYIVNSIKLKGC